jgi:hypothetical protein
MGIYTPVRKPIKVPMRVDNVPKALGLFTDVTSKKTRAPDELTDKRITTKALSSALKGRNLPPKRTIYASPRKKVSNDINSPITREDKI